MDPQQIISVVVSLIVLAVGIFAFFTTTTQIPKAGTGHAGQEAINNSTKTAGQVFNIVGIVIMIGAIMSIIGIIYSYLRPY
jgi:hypothetical protein